MTLMTLSEERLRRELRQRIWIGLILLFATVAVAVFGVRFILAAENGVRGFTILLGLLVLKMVFVAAVVYWLTRPIQERTRRRRLVIRQAIGTFPAEQE